MKKDICVIFDVGKTNKKVLVFDDSFNVVYEKSSIFEEVLDEDGDPCDDLLAISKWLKEEWYFLSLNTDYQIKGVNFSGYGASLVYLNNEGSPIAPLYNYLKKISKSLKSDFVKKYNQEGDFFLNTASPDLDLLNSGLQLFWVKNIKAHIFKNSASILHFPQYLSFCFTHKCVAELTSIGCHTAMWDFKNKNYHEWLSAEHLEAAMLPCVTAVHTENVNGVEIGPGIHDSSAALVPYLKAVNEPFVLISTGTWCISLNPFDKSPLSKDLLEQDCLNYISFDGSQVRASRLFSGNEHNRQVKHLSDYFHCAPDYYKSVVFDYKTVQFLRGKLVQATPQNTQLGRLQDCPFVERNLNSFRSFEEAYHQFIMDLVAQQVASTRLVFGSQMPKKLFVDGGFSKNEIFMNLLSEAFHNIQVFSSDVAQASSVGAVLVISDKIGFNNFDINKLKLKRF